MALYPDSTDQRPGSTQLRWVYASITMWAHPVWSALFALVPYTLLAQYHHSITRASAYPYFNYLADAFLHAQLNLRVLPRILDDLSLFAGQYYLYWPPFPAVLLMPFVALFGVGFSDVIFTIVLAAVNVALVALILRQACRRNVLQLTKLQCGLLTLFFCLGTVQVTLGSLGRVWFTAQEVGFFCVALAYLSALSLRGWRAFVVTSFALAGAFLTRNHLLFNGLWPACYILYEHRTAIRARVLGFTLIGLVPICGAIGLFALYNWMRFGSVVETGLSYQKMAVIFRANYQQYGPFNLHYVPTNLFYQYIAYPFPRRPTTWYGGSLFLLSPVFFGAVWGFMTGHPRWSVWTLLATIVVVAIPILLLLGTGWVQFGPRYTLDFTLPLLLLTAIGVRHWRTRFLVLLTIISVVQYLIGAIYLSGAVA